MRKLELLFVLVLLILFQSLVSAQNVSPQFSELKGMEDPQGNTHLLYRIHSYQRNDIAETGKNDVYNMVPGTSIDTIYLHDSYTCSIYMGWGETVIDYDFWDNDLTKFIYAGDRVNCFEPSPFISRFDSALVYHDWMTFTQDIFISKQNDSLVFGLPNLISYDGGFNWDTLELEHQPISIAAYDDKTYFANEYLAYTSLVYKSTDSGNSFALVDTGGSNWNPKFFYDVDENHIYRTHTIDYPNRSLKGSANQGNAFTWQTLYETSNDFFVCLDETQSGAIYLADGKKIFFSGDYGSTFNLFKELDKKIIGIYKKPNSDKLYAATKYKLYEITNDNITLLKSLPTPVEALEFYPLKVGNRWVYERTDYSIDWITGSTIIETSFFDRRVTAIQTKPNGMQYYQIDDYDFYLKQSKVSFERIDSVSGLIYRYDESLDTMNYEFVIDDLMAELGEEIISCRLNSYYSPVQMLFNSEDYFADLGLYGKRNGYLGGYWGSDYYSLVRGVGLDSVFVSVIDAFDAHIDLVGCVLNGVVYGDTTLTGVEDENYLAPTEFYLGQNFPNPYNSQTTISYSIPNSSLVQIQIFDVLGKEVSTLLNEEKSVGSYKINFNASELTSGVYFYQLKAGDYVETKKMIVLK